MNYKWTYDNKKQHCSDCYSLNGQVRTLDQWQMTIMPGSPNLECGGTRCGCQLEPTTLPITPASYDPPTQRGKRPPTRPGKRAPIARPRPRSDKRKARPPQAAPQTPGKRGPRPPQIAPHKPPLGKRAPVARPWWVVPTKPGKAAPTPKKAPQPTVTSTAAGKKAATPAIKPAAPVPAPKPPPSTPAPSTVKVIGPKKE